MIRIPTGPVPKNAARTSLFLPQYARPVAEVGGILTDLGLTLGKQ